MFALLVAAQAGATETCATNKPQPNVRRQLEKQAARLLAPDAVNSKSLWFCAYGGVDAEAVIEALPRRQPDGSDLVRQAWCQRVQGKSPTRWTCRPSEFRKTEVTVELGGAPSRFTVVLVSQTDPDVARRAIEQALALSSQVTAQNRCAVAPGKYELQTFNSDFAVKPSPENDRFMVYSAADAWQVSRRVSSMTLVIPAGGVPQLKCWSVADEL